MIQLKARQCTLCQQYFKRLSGLKKHQFLKHKIHNQQFECNVCNLDFKDEANLKIHMQTHSNFKHSCSECGEKFGYKSHLKDHLKFVHKMAFSSYGVLKPVKERMSMGCNHCSEEFKSKSKLEEHTQIIHGSNFETFESRSKKQRHILTSHGKYRRFSF